ncbi:MAG: hypothetical protein R3301_10740, partial [Saprospiraceae bacterium]|nr:hypothetical protein [Saprospiraceae bacterium]
TDAGRLKSDSGNVAIGLTVEDFGAMYDRLKEQGIAVTERGEEGGRFLHFSDPDGTSLYVIEPSGD